MGFSVKTLVEETKRFIQLDNQIKSAGYNPYLFKQKMDAKSRVERQHELYNSELKQLKLKNL